MTSAPAGPPRHRRRAKAPRPARTAVGHVPFGGMGRSSNRNQPVAGTRRTRTPILGSEASGVVLAPRELRVLTQPRSPGRAAAAEHKVGDRQLAALLVRFQDIDDLAPGERPA